MLGVVERSNLVVVAVIGDIVSRNVHLKGAQCNRESALIVSLLRLQDKYDSQSVSLPPFLRPYFTRSQFVESSSTETVLGGFQGDM